ncbi:hypothetical protein V2I29_08330, partial [Campylobacter sp. CX2-8023-23]|nr:hypothetical protein [Campylobacter sp. CX2-8023-23]
MSGNAVEPKSDLSVKISVDEWVKELAGINPNKQIIADLELLYEKHKELFSKPSEVFKLIKAVKENPTFFYTNNQPNIALIGSILENGKLGKIGIQKDFNGDNLQVRHATYSSNAKKENERLLKRNSYPVGSPTPTQLTFGKTAEPTANGAKALLGRTDGAMAETPAPATTNAKTIPNQSIKEAENQANLAKTTAEFSKAYNAIKNIGKYTGLFENDYKKIASLSTKDFTQRLKNDIQAYEELARLQEIAYKATNGLLNNDEYMRYFNVRQGEKGYLTKAQSIQNNAFEILDQAPNYISGLYNEISRLKALKSLSKEQDEALNKALKQVNQNAILDLAGNTNYNLMATKLKTALNALTRAKKILDEAPTPVAKDPLADAPSELYKAHRKAQLAKEPTATIDEAPSPKATTAKEQEPQKTTNETQQFGKTEQLQTKEQELIELAKTLGVYNENYSVERLSQRVKDQLETNAHIKEIEINAINKIEALNNFKSGNTGEKIQRKKILAQAEQELKEFAKSIGTSDEKLQNYSVKSINDLREQISGLSVYLSKTKNEKGEALANKYSKILVDIDSLNIDRAVNRAEQKEQIEALKKEAVAAVRELGGKPLHTVSLLAARHGKSDEFLTKNLITKDELNRARELLQKEQKIEPIKEFGVNYAEFYHDGKNAIQKLLTERQGQVAGAFERKELGDI